MLSRMLKVCWLLVLVGLSFTLLTPYAFGISYKYYGPNFMYGSSQYSTSDYLTAELNLSEPLQSNFSGVLDLTTLPGFYLAFSDGYRILTTSTPGLNTRFANIYSTDSLGMPSLWELVLSAQIAPETYMNMVSSLVHGRDYNQNDFYQKYDISQIVITTGGIENGVYQGFIEGPDSTGWGDRVPGGPPTVPGPPTVQGPLTVPEPSTIILFGVGMAGLAGVSLRKRKS